MEKKNRLPIPENNNHRNSPMKKLVFAILASALSAIACQEIEQPAGHADNVKDLFHACIEDISTKTTLNEENGVAWSKGDQITIYNRKTLGSRYQVKDSYEGQTSASFFNVSSEDFGEEAPLDHIIAYYPASGVSECSQNGSGYQLSVSLPSTQTYSEASFGQGSFPMVAISGSSDLSFRNICGAIRLPLTGIVKVASVKITGRGNEKLSGNAFVTVGEGKPEISMSDKASASVTLDCGDGVQLHDGKTTDFMISLPPTSFAKGFTVTVTDIHGEEYKIETSKTNEVLRSSILNMPAVDITSKYENLVDNKIWYTATEKITPYVNRREGFGADIISNEYDEDTKQGLIIFDGTVTSIGYGSFQNCEALTSLTIGDSVTCIYDHAFDNCTNLTSVNIPEGVTSIGSYAFQNCSSIVSLTLPESVTEFGGYPFQNCTGELTINCNIPDDEYDGPFSDSKITKVTIGENVTKIGDNAFNDCSALTSVILPEGLLYIGMFAFSTCENLTDLNIPESVEHIGFSAFDNCYSLKNVVLPEGITTIEGQTFFACKSLESVTIPESVTSIGFSAFWMCTSLKSISLPDGITTIGHDAFEFCTALEGIVLPASLKVLEESIFYNCPSLRKVVIPEGLTEIEKDAFKTCESLESVIIPESVTKIGDEAFRYCRGLTDVYMNPLTPPEVGTELFRATSLKRIHVPETSLEAYGSAPGWSEYQKYMISDSASDIPS